MLNEIQLVPQMIKNWKNNRDELYNLFASIAFVLVVISITTRTRPTEALAIAAHSIGLTPVTKWLTMSAPPLIAAEVEFVNAFMLGLTALLLICMVIVPLWRGRERDERTYPYEFADMPGSPSAATVWILLMVGAQHGDIAKPLQEAVMHVGAIALGAVTLIVIIFVVGILANRYGAHKFTNPLFKGLTWLASRGITGVMLVAIAVVTAAVGFPLSILGWMARFQSDRSAVARAHIAAESANRRLPTGALPLR